jgi:anti-anti-sigma factor
MMACASDSQKPAPHQDLFVGIEPHGCICILRCQGRFVSGPQIDYMQSKLNEVKQQPCTHLLADFQGVTAIGSMGIGFLVGIYTSIVSRAGGQFVLTGANPMVRTVLSLTLLDTVIPLAPDVASGLRMLEGSLVQP